MRVSPHRLREAHLDGFAGQTGLLQSHETEMHGRPWLPVIAVHGEWPSS